MAAMNMNQEQFEQAIREKKPVLVDFWAPWLPLQTPPCHGGYAKALCPHEAY